MEDAEQPGVPSMRHALLFGELEKGSIILMRFDSKARRYETMATVQRKLALWCSQWLESDLKGRSSLEFGSGPGTFTRHLVARGCSRLTASDISLRMVEEGRKRLPQVDFRVLDAWAPPRCRVERIYSTSLLQWAPDPSNVLSRWRQLLTSEGRMLICMFVAGSLREFLDQGSDLSALKWRTDEQWLQEVRDAGFSVARHDTWNETLYFPSAVSALRSVHDIGACAREPASVPVLKKSLARYERATRTRDGIPLSWRALRIEALASDIRPM